jgi:hypothetical protein
MKASSAVAPRAQHTSPQALAARHDVHHLNAAIERAIRSAGDAYQFTANSYTFAAMNDAMALRNLVAIVAEHIVAAFPEEAGHGEH